MKIGKTLYVVKRKDWRSWLSKNHKTAKEIWLIYYKKASGKPRIPYDDAVEEALCYGWIDTTVKRLDEKRFAQRFTHRRKGSVVSETNKVRIRRMIKAGKMTRYGLAQVEHALGKGKRGNGAVVVAGDIQKALKKDPAVWKYYQAFPKSYKRIRIWWIEIARTRPDIFKTRLNYFVRMTAKNKRYGMVC